MVWFLRARRERRLAELDDLRRTRKLVEEDVTTFGEQLSDLHVETLTTELDSDLRFDYQRSLDRYEDAKTSLREAATTAGPAQPSVDQTRCRRRAASAIEPLIDG